MESSDSDDPGNDSDVVLLYDENEFETDLSDTDFEEYSSHSDSMSDNHEDPDFDEPFSDQDDHPPLNDSESTPDGYLTDTEVEGDASSQSDSTFDLNRDTVSEAAMPEDQNENTTESVTTGVPLTRICDILRDASSAPSTSSSSPLLLPNLAQGISTTSDNLATSNLQCPSTSTPEEAVQGVVVTEIADENGKSGSVEKTISPTSDSPRGKKRKKESRKDESADSEEDSCGQTCPICMDEWSNSGSHRLCCLRCGHIYGESCIRRWLTSTSVSSGRCPQCNAKAKIRDIRPLFARSLRAIDTAERDRLASQLEDAKRERERLELEVTRITMSHQMQQSQVIKLQAELECLRKGKTGPVIPESKGERSHNSTTESGSGTLSTIKGITRDGNSCHFSLRSTVEIAREGGCRVAAHCEALNLIVVSQRSTNPLFPGFGVKKVDAIEFRATQFVPAHPKPIRDLAFAPPSAPRCLLLSASFDCTARLLDVGGGANAVVATLSADTPLWSCCWDACDPNLLYVGTQGGVVLSFDLRRTSAPLSRITDPDEITPVISLVPVQPSHGRALPLGGLLSCHLSSCWAHNSSNTSSFRLPLEGPFTALRYDAQTQHFLVSARPSVRTPHARHSVCERAIRETRDPGGQEAEGASPTFSVCNPPIHTFLGGTSQRVLSRPCLMPVGRDLVVAAHQESSSTVALWSVGTGSRVATIPASDPVIDVCPLITNEETHVALLTEKMLRLYKIH